MWGISIKEMEMVRQFQNLLPRTTMMGFGEPIVDDIVRLTTEENVTLYSWLNDGVKEEGYFIEA